MDNKTVRDLIGSDIKCKLGASNGSAFVFCGNMLHADASEIDETIRDSYRTTLRNTEKNITLLSNKDRSYSAYEKEMERKQAAAFKEYRNYPDKLAKRLKEIQPSEMGWHQWDSDITRSLEYAKTKRKKYRRRLREYTSIADRAITEIYTSIDEANTLIVLYEGDEQGIAWTTKEYIHGVHEED